jgi:superfamily II DNA/RNA helicase
LVSPQQNVGRDWIYEWSFFMRRTRPRGWFTAKPSYGRRVSPSTEFKTLSLIERYIQSSTVDVPQQVDTEIAEVLPGFSGYDLPKHLMDSIDYLGFVSQTPIQAKVIPVAMSGRDVIGIAQTGTGKTLSFLVPLITKMQKGELNRVLIMAPTRELAVQIADDFYKLTRGSQLRSALCIGGTSVRQQIKMLQRPYQFLIGTPGRIKDMYQQGQIHTADFDGLVLDEIDRMLDMGFIRDVREILSTLPRKRQSLFFSATLPREVEVLCRTFAYNPELLVAKSQEKVYPISQKVMKLEAGQRKFEVLYDLMCNQEEYKKVIIFGRTKHGVRRLAEELDRRGFAVDSLHGNKSQSARQRSLDMFKSDRVSVLVATDVAARGIDVANITHVINYDLPESLDDYIHRIGRTGRAGHTGEALTLVEGNLY